ncbi:magnesium transporter CorA family protein [Sunxiuqinia elliptica]|uniref:Magnesium transporter n=1 Tax=Sunxiuqinia elliptica TaxID=655355 RepID=A0A1I2JE78_9BACT|nr:magnesium transporter CorA family protein [Sunxiuqinia elliptica]TDN99817.1 magnesium transporter [Sunxiuqinia elliptica]TDO57009.1 magnesium transporter [Sunxiuqinia elliptica]SFF50971.1 magnesium transporter [Sunxiuqinia elliptica]
MLKIFKSFGGYSEIPQAEKGCWINVVQPTQAELNQLQEEFQVPADIVQDIMDVDERPRYEVDEDWSLIILRIPVESPNNGVPYYTLPLGIFRSNEITITLCSTVNQVLPLEKPALYRGQTLLVHDELNFIIRLFLRSGSSYLQYLKQINHQTTQIETELEKSVRNKELNKLLKMEKCLVFFITSLKANEIVLAKLRNALKKNMTELNEDLLEDAIIENKQALEMSQIYSDIQSGMMDAFASVISNNLNVRMKQLASISIILMIPTLVASLYGMNVPNHLESNTWAFPVIIIFSVALATLGIIIFRKKELF